MGFKVNLTRIQDGLRTRSIGKTVFFAREVGSTNEWAKELASQKAPEGTVVLAETQTRGRGRLGRTWISPLGGLWFSVILRPRISLSDVSQLTFVAGLAVAQTLDDLYDLKVETKWPNDVLIDGRKVCGILGEASSNGEKTNFVVLGVGVNGNFDSEQIFPRRIRSNTTSLERELGQKVRLEQLFDALLEKLEKTFDFYAREGFMMILSEWKKYACFLGHKVEVNDHGKRIEGTAHDVSQDGALVIRRSNGSLTHVFVGDITLRTSPKPMRDIRKLS
jgi:biotin-[acetyl-CoA-carboxylase] ligase BirA-like protein